VHVSKAPLFSPEECQAIIDECEERAAKVGWATKRHFGREGGREGVRAGGREGGRGCRAAIGRKRMEGQGREGGKEGYLYHTLQARIIHLLIPPPSPSPFLSLPYH